ncbi:MAG: hypothetical protein E7572_05270 [Ruminococcaceae bacterium]|jgi:recombination protein RecT|nr:hypothetical protein [Oscillospiraceae bacterium]
MANTQIVSMSKYLSQPSINSYVHSMLGERAPQFINALTQLASSSYQLKKCDRNSLLSCALKSASLNLAFDPALGQSWAVPYKNKDGSYSAQFQIGARGITQLAVRSGQYAGINAMEVKEGEFEGRDFLGDPIIKWLPENERSGKETIGYFAGFKTVNGYSKTIYWTKQQVEEHAERFSQGYRYYKTHGASTSASRSGNKESPWVSDFDAMACKTVLKYLISHYGAMSTEMQAAVKVDQSKIDTDFDTGEETIDYVDNDEPEAPQQFLTGEQQNAMLEKYGGGKVAKACEVFGVKTLNEVPADSIESFTAILESQEE